MTIVNALVRKIRANKDFWQAALDEFFKVTGMPHEEVEDYITFRANFEYKNRLDAGEFDGDD